jgi:hypothetical protein
MELLLNPQITKPRPAPTTMQEPPSRIRKVGVRLRRQRAKNERQFLILHQLNRIAQDHQVITASILQCRHVSMPHHP